MIFGHGRGNDYCPGHDVASALLAGVKRQFETLEHRPQFTGQDTLSHNKCSWQKKGRMKSTKSLVHYRHPWFARARHFYQETSQLSNCLPTYPFPLSQETRFLFIRYFFFQLECICIFRITYLSINNAEVGLLIIYWDPSETRSTRSNDECQQNLFPISNSTANWNPQSTFQGSTLPLITHSTSASLLLNVRELD